MALIKRPTTTPAPSAAPAAIVGVAKTQLNVLVTPALKRDLKMRAAADGTSANEIVERVLREYLDR